MYMENGMHHMCAQAAKLTALAAKYPTMIQIVHDSILYDGPAHGDAYDEIMAYMNETTQEN